MWLCSSWGCFLIIWDEKHSTEGGRELWSASLLISGVNSNCGLISSRPRINATSAPPEKTPSRSCEQHVKCNMCPCQLEPGHIFTDCVYLNDRFLP